MRMTHVALSLEEYEDKMEMNEPETQNLGGPQMLAADEACKSYISANYRLKTESLIAQGCQQKGG